MLGLSLVDLTLATGVPEQIESSETRLYDPAADEVPDPPSEGRAGKVPILELDLGGCGNEAMLTVFLSVRSGVGPVGLPIPLAVVFRVGIAGVETVWCGFCAATGIVALDGVRIANFEGVCEFDEGRPESCGFPRLFRVFGTGSGGNAALGGAHGGSDGRGRDFVVAMVKESERQRKTAVNVYV